MNPLSAHRARRLARPHLLALAAVLALPATVGAQATNTWSCAGGGWNGDPVCWSLNATPNNTQNVVVNGSGLEDTNLMLLHAIGNTGTTIAARSLTLGTDRTGPTPSATAQLYMSGLTLAVGSATGSFAGFVSVGQGNNANATLNLTNGSTLNFPTFGESGGVSVGGLAATQTGFGALSVQGGGRIAGGVVNIYNGRLDVHGSSTPGYLAIESSVHLRDYAGAVGGGVANIAASVGAVTVERGRATLGTTNAGFQSPAFLLVTVQGPVVSGIENTAVDFVGRSVVTFRLTLRGGVTSIKGGASVDNNSGRTELLNDAQLIVESGGSLNTGNTLNNRDRSSIQLKGGTINHRGIDNAGTVSGTGVIDSVLETQTFKQQATGNLQASGGDLILYGRFDGSVGGTIGTQNGRLYFWGDAVFKPGQVITQSGTGGLIIFGFGKVEIGNATQRGSLTAMTNDLALQNTSNLFLDFGGVADHDYLSTGGGLLVESGKLTLSTAGSFQAGLGSFFSIFRATSGITGTFSSIDTTAFALAPGARLDMSNLYTTGTLAVVAVPEPATWLSLGAGLLLIGARARRWRQEA